MDNFDYLYNPDAAKDRFSKNYFVDKKLHFRIIERGTILPHKDMCVNGKSTWGFGGITDKRGEFIKSSFVHSGVGSAYTPSEDVKHSPATVIYLGLFYPVWGHVITDNIRRLWFLKSEVFKEYFSNCPLVYVDWGGMNLFNRKIFSVCLKFWKSTLIDFTRLNSRRNLKISFCRTSRSSWTPTGSENSLTPTVRRSTA